MTLLVPGLALAPELFCEHYPHIDIIDPWETTWINASDALRKYDDDATATLIGHSLGGLVALEWALRYPEKVQRLILLDSTAPTLDEKTQDCTTTAAKSSSAPAGWTAQILSRILQPIIPAEVQSLASAEVLSQRYFGYRNLSFLYEQARQAQVLQNRVARLLDEQPLASHIDVVVLVGAGKGDEHDFFTEQKDLAKQLGTTPVMIWGAGHLFPLTHPQCVQQFIQFPSPA